MCVCACMCKKKKIYTYKNSNYFCLSQIPFACFLLSKVKILCCIISRFSPQLSFCCSFQALHAVLNDCVCRVNETLAIFSTCAISAFGTCIIFAFLHIQVRHKWSISPLKINRGHVWQMAIVSSGIKVAGALKNSCRVYSWCDFLRS